MYAGAITLTQPQSYTWAVNQSIQNVNNNMQKNLARQQHHTGMQEVILSTDQAYWQVISLVNKKKLGKDTLEIAAKT